MDRREVEVNGGRLAFEAAGDGEGVVFLHPGLWDMRTWDPQFGVFSRVYRAVRYDVRGYGRSSRPQPGRPYSHVEDLVAVMDAAGLDHAALVGCSMGGRIALDAALAVPGRVAALVLAASAAGGFEDVTAEEESEWEALDRPVEEAIELGELERAQELRLRIWAPLGTADEAGQRIRQIALDNLHELTMDESGAEELDPPAFERLEEVAAPTLVLPADHDPMYLRRLGRVLAERIPNARLVEIPNVDHVVGLRRPAEFNAAVLGFLGEILG